MCHKKDINQIKVTQKYVKVIQETGVSALAVHGRTKDERPNNDVHLEYIQEVSKVSTLSVNLLYAVYSSFLLNAGVRITNILSLLTTVCHNTNYSEWRK